jgi:CxxC motif-containing protein (DUF1111 family)
MTVQPFVLLGRIHRGLIAVGLIAFSLAISQLSTASMEPTLGRNTLQQEAARGQYFGDPLENLTVEQLQEFERGFDLFIKVWTVGEGIGPHINARSCVACHRVPTPGGSGTSHDTFVIHSSRAVDSAGGTVVPRFEVRSDDVLIDAPFLHRTTKRKTPGLFGLGLLEAVPVGVVLEYADPTDKDRDGISGRVVRVGKQVGRFGWKGGVPTIESFVKHAFSVEMGLHSEPEVTNEKPQLSAPVEVSVRQIRLVTQFIRFLGSPRPTYQTDVNEGAEQFRRAGCESCHRSSLRLSSRPVSLVNRTIPAFTDLLVHDMGPELNDGLEEHGTSGREFRTPPLWGIASTGPPYLHDGRAKTLHEAISAHGGEAATAVTKYRALSELKREALLRFVNSL